MTASSARSFNWGLWVKWILANAVGITVGQFVGSLLGFLSGGLVAQGGDQNIGALVAFAVLGVTTGLALGLIQRLFIQQEIDLPRLWIGRTALGWGLGYLLAALNASATSAALGDFLSGIVSWALIGAFVGTAQYSILRAEVERAGSWIAINILGWVLGQPLAALGMGAAVSLGVSATDSSAALIAFILIGAASGFLTGLGLLWLLRRPARQAVAEK